MIVTLKIVIAILLVFAALGLLCAVRIGRRATPPADPFFHPFGEMPGFTAEQLRAIAPPIKNNDPLRRSFAKHSRLAPAQASMSPGRLNREGRVIASNAPPAPIPASRSLDLKPSGVALRPDADGGGPFAPSGLAAVRKFFRGLHG